MLPDPWFGASLVEADCSLSVEEALGDQRCQATLRLNRIRPDGEQPAAGHTPRTVPDRPEQRSSALTVRTVPRLRAPHRLRELR